MKMETTEKSEGQIILDNDELPEGWSEIPLSKILSSLESGSRPKGGVRGIDSGVPSIGGEHLNERGGFRFENIKYVPLDFFEKIRRGKIQTNDILIIKDGATTGKVSLVRSDFPYNPAMVNEHVFICRFIEGIYSSFVFYFLFSKIGQKRMLENFQGSAQGGINQAFAENTFVPIAPFAEQQRIVARVEALLAHVDAARDRLSRVPLIMKRFRKAVLEAACSGRLTEGWREENFEEIASQNDVIENFNLFDIPSQWQLVLLPKLGYLKRGRSKNRPRNAPHLFGGKYPFIQTGDISQSGGRITSHKQTYSEAGLAQSKIWPEKTVCITIAANIAESAILTYPACFPDSVVGFIADDALCLPEYIEYFMRLAKRDLAQFAPATAQKNINIEILNEVTVPLPSLAEQHEIVCRVNALFERADAAMERKVVGATTNRIEALSQAILAKAFRGEL